MVKELLLVPLFEKFIRETKNGRRRKLNGERIKSQTIVNYRYALKQLVEFENDCGRAIRIKLNLRNNQRQLVQENIYWKDFYRQLSDFLYYKKGCFDNFTGSVFKQLKCFFRYLKFEKYLPVPDCFRHFYVKKENIRVISVLPERFCFLVLDKEFEYHLTRAQKRIKDMFVFGAMAALRYSDLLSLRSKDIECQSGQYYLAFRSVKTDTPVTIKLPEFALGIIKKFARERKPDAKIFPQLSKGYFNCKDLQPKLVGQNLFLKPGAEMEYRKK